MLTITNCMIVHTGGIPKVTATLMSPGPLTSRGAVADRGRQVDSGRAARPCGVVEVTRIAANTLLLARVAENARHRHTRLLSSAAVVRSERRPSFCNAA